MSETSGLTTMVVCGRTAAGTWIAHALPSPGGKDAERVVALEHRAHEHVPVPA